jgi:nitroreductase
VRPGPCSHDSTILGRARIKVESARAGLYHYLARDHALERRVTLASDAAARLVALLPVGGFLVGLSSVHWREAWKYGERAFRYCQHDAGHAIATMRYAAGALGWRALVWDGLGDDRVSALLGLDRDPDFADVEAADREHPDAALLVLPGGLEPDFSPPPSGQASAAEEVVALIRAGVWSGRANPLSPSHVEWEAIDLVARATRRPAGELPMPCPSAPLSSQPKPRPSSRTPAATLILQRRSAVALDGRTSISARTFYAMLDHLLPRTGVAPSLFTVSRGSSPAFTSWSAVPTGACAARCAASACGSGPRDAPATCRCFSSCPWTAAKRRSS